MDLVDLENNGFYQLAVSYMYIYVCFCLAGDGVLWCRLSYRLGEEHKGQLSERRLDRLYLQRDTESKTLKVKS